MYTEEEQKTRKEKHKSNKQRSTKHTHKPKPKDQVTRALPHTGGELRCSKRVSSSCSTSGTLGSIASLLAATFYQGNPDRNHKLWNIVSTERNILHKVYLHLA
jgi:hypothetical protein